MEKELNINQATLVGAWQQQLPEMLGPGDSTIVQADAANPNAINVHINVAGHQMYAFDFRCSYQDTREVQVEMLDTRQAGRSCDVYTDTVQELAQDYTRHLHECAQVLHSITDPA